MVEQRIRNAQVACSSHVSSSNGGERPAASVTPTVKCEGDFLYKAPSRGRIGYGMIFYIKIYIFLTTYKQDIVKYIQ